MGAPSAPSRIGVIGGSWRAQYFFRIARELPEWFSIAGCAVRTETSASRLGAQWSFPVVNDLDALRALGPLDYVVISVPRAENRALIETVAGWGVPVLVETPPAEGIGGLDTIYRAFRDHPIQVAEQYVFQPQHAARLAVAAGGLLGAIQTATVSVAHDYHGISLLRRILGFTVDEELTIDARRFTERTASIRGRDAWLPEVDEATHERVVAFLSGRERWGEYDFTGEQYFSPIRRRRLSIRGTRGELVDDEVRYVQEPGSVIEERLFRETTGADGDLEGFYLRCIGLGARALFRTRFPGARLNDDELAVADVMARMQTYVDTGVSFSSLADGCHDAYVAHLMAESAREQRPVRTTPQSWSARA